MGSNILVCLLQLCLLPFCPLLFCHFVYFNLHCLLLVSICSLNSGWWMEKWGGGRNPLVLMYALTSGGREESFGADVCAYQWVVWISPWYCCPCPHSTPWPTPTSLLLTQPLSVSSAPLALSLPTHAGREELHKSRNHFNVSSQNRSTIW